MTNDDRRIFTDDRIHPVTLLIILGGALVGLAFLVAVAWEVVR